MPVGAADIEYALVLADQLDDLGQGRTGLRRSEFGVRRARIVVHLRPAPLDLASISQHGLGSYSKSEQTFGKASAVTPTVILSPAVTCPALSSLLWRPGGFSALRLLGGRSLKEWFVPVTSQSRMIAGYDACGGAVHSCFSVF